jgi:hypothetical protein
MRMTSWAGSALETRRVASLRERRMWKADEGTRAYRRAATADSSGSSLAVKWRRNGAS